MKIVQAKINFPDLRCFANVECHS